MNLNRIIVVSQAERTKVEKLSGSTNSSKRKRQEKIIAMKNYVTAEYIELKKRKRGRVIRGVLDGIISRQKKIYGLEDIHVQASTIRQRVLRKHPVVNHHHCGSHQSPLVTLDDAIVNIMLTMA